MLSKIQSVVLVLVTAMYSIFQILEITFKVPQDLLTAAVNIIFAILALFWTARKAFQAFKFNVTATDIEKLMK